MKTALCLGASILLVGLLGGCPSRAEKKSPNAPAAAPGEEAPAIKAPAEKAPPATAPAATKPAKAESKAPGDPAAAAAKWDYSAALSGKSETPPVETKATGQFDLRVGGDEKSATYQLVVHDLSDLLMAHLHEAAAGKNGDIVVWLYPLGQTAPKLVAGISNGTVASGVLTADNLVGPMKGKTIADLVAKIKAGDIYVQVHTKAHPEGELRGQVQAIK